MLEVIAIMTSPVIAVWIGQVLNERRERVRRRHQVFQALWLTRVDHGSFGRLSAEHVRALNMIEIEFAKTQLDDLIGRGEALDRVLETWRTYWTALHSTPQKVMDDVNCPEASAWFSARDELLVELLFEIGGALGYKIDRERIRASAYAPMSYLSGEAESMAMRTAIRQLIDGERALHITGEPPKPPAQAVALPAGAHAELPEASKGGNGV
ncbi:MAG TPA: DUF6680 family protein [Kofleriaceae bacterium]